MDSAVMKFSGADEPLPSNPSSEIEKIDKYGDVVLRLQDETTGAITSLLVSSKVLSLASPVFAALVGPSFREGKNIQRGDCPVIELPDDDPATMSIVCNLLHFRYDRVPTQLAPTQLGQLGILCDKYDCSKPVLPWSQKWLGEHKEAPFADLGLMLLAAYKLDDADYFAAISTRLINGLVPRLETWDRFPELQLLPDRAKGDMLDRAEVTIEELQITIEGKEGKLRDFGAAYRMDGQLCGDCGRKMPANAKKCHPCNNSDLLPDFCNRESRVAAYFFALRQGDLWPWTQILSKVSVRALSVRMGQLYTSLRHDCVVGLGCPLKQEVAALVEPARRIEESVRGLCLDCLRRDRDPDLNRPSSESKCRTRHAD